MQTWPTQQPGFASTTANSDTVTTYLMSGSSRISCYQHAAPLSCACVSVVSMLQTPSDWANAGGHGTHVSGIAVGGFPHKLKDRRGNVLPYQRGVAFGAKLGAIRVSSNL
jgi:hypothetical protein